MAENIISNPFVGCTARDMKFEEVKQYWCSPFKLYQLNEGELFNSRTPIVIEGVRGTGKTMILKYLSYSVQKDSLTKLSFEQKLNYFKERSIGVYFRYKEDFCNLFDQLDCSKKDKELIFLHYYELAIIRQIIEILEDIYQEVDSTSVANIICSYLKIENMPLNETRIYINQSMRQMDRIINSSSYDDGWRDKIMPLIGTENMVVELIQTISHSLFEWNDILFVILLDEYENLGDFQTIVNTLIKQVDDTVNLSYRLGMRPAGMDNNNKTNIAGEPIQVDRDFLLRRLEYKSFAEYKRFALDISEKRLENIEIYSQNGIVNINTILGKNENFDAEAASIAKGVKHFRILKKYSDTAVMQDVISELSCENKLMEMYNIIRVARGEEYKKIGELCRKYQHLENKQNILPADEELYKYHLDYSSKYRVTMLYLLLTLYGERKQYYSVNTFLYLSNGSINDFISLCRNTFKHVNHSMLEDLKVGKSISSQIQTYAAIDTAEDQRKKVSMSDKYGKAMYTFIDNMGSIFEEYHRDLEARYPETNQFAFANENKIRNNKKLNGYLVELINSGAIVRKKKRQAISVGKQRGYIYVLNRIYAPIYQYSYRTRGGYNQIIDEVDFEIMLRESIYPKKYVGRNKNTKQFAIYEYVGDEDDGTKDI